MFSLKYSLKLGCALACAVFLAGATFAMSWSYPSERIGDTYVDKENEDEIFGTDETLWVSSEDGDPVRESWITFETARIKEALGIESPDDVASATLKVYVDEVETPGEVELHFYNEGFFEEDPDLTWVYKPDYDDEVDWVEEIDDAGWVEFDATKVVKKAIEECPDCPFSVALVAAGDASVGFASKEDADGNAPVLKVTTIEE
ncbi:MAG TPA: DNRLRE domain-containing protein [Methanothrix sp.]|nr:DNRLRE domain-containing protein [Methanothrix sp.]